MKKMFAITMVAASVSAHAEIAATHIYHNHMPNFWPYYDVSEYDNLAVGEAVRYAYDGQVINLKQNPPANYSFFIPSSGAPMPHDDLVSYYQHHAKTGAYLSWPMDTAKSNHGNHPQSQTHVTMSAAVINNVQSFAELANLDGYNLGWGAHWREVQANTKTSGGFNALDTIHFSGHHTMGPLVGNEYFLKDLIYQNVTLAQDYFLGDAFKSSKGFFPTELGFSERIIPVLNKLGIEWSVLGNVHYSRTLRDYPYLNDPGVDTLISPPNRADLQNESNIGAWTELHMFNEQQNTINKFPFASIPHWVQYVDPESGEQYKVAGIPVEQASSWEEGYQCKVTADVIKPFVDDAASLGRTQFFTIAHDGDNSSGCAGDGNTWANSGNVTYADTTVRGMGVEEYLAAHPIPAEDVVHVQDGSWIDTRDSSADPTWYHWHIPMGVWKGQMADFNTANGTDFVATREHMVSLELGYHYLERNFALLQAAENYAKTAEQIWLDNNPNYWSPSTERDHQVTYPGNQLNPWMMSFPLKGDPANNYAGGANPAELGWYFLLASIDSGFGYYDENIDDGVKPTVSFNQSLHFSVPYVEANLSQDKTGPSLWWPQRYPYNPGSANASKAEGWAKVYADTKFAIYTYGYDVSDIQDIKVKVRVHKDKWATATDKTFKLYDPSAHSSDPNVDPSRVGEWQSFAMSERDLSADINGVSWQPSGKEIFEVVPADKIGNMYFSYIEDFQEQLLDYYIEARDSKGNITRSAIQQVYVGAGQFSHVDGKLVEDVNGSVAGEAMFFTDDVIIGDARPVADIDASDAEVAHGTVVTLSAAGSTDSEGPIASYLWSTGETTPTITLTLNERTTISVTVTDSVGQKASTSVSYRIIGQTVTSSVYYQDSNGWGQVCLHYSIDGGLTWTTAPGVAMQSLADNWYRLSIDLDNADQLEFVANSCSGAWDNNGGANYSAGEGDWQVAGGVILAGIPDGVDGNIAPVAVISPASHTVAVGTEVTLSAAGSSDSDGSISSYAWSTGETSQSITLTVTETQTITLTVTDDAGKTNTASVTLNVAENVLPIAVISPASQTVIAGSVVTLSAAGSFDEDGQVLSYLWSTGETTAEIDVTVNQSMTVGLTVTDNDEGQASTEVLLSLATENFAANFEQLYFRGTANGWQSSAMSLIADHTWQVLVDFDGQTEQRFKFDVNGDWSQNYGDNNSDGVLEQSGGDIFTAVSGVYWVEVNDQELAYRIVEQNVNQAPTAVITASATQIDIGQSISYSAAASSDSDGSITGYLWSNGANTETTTITYDAVGSYELSLTVTDDGDKTGQASVFVTVVDPNANFVANFENLYFRGTANAWQNTAMSLVRDNIWQVTISFDGQSGQRFKFDTVGDWSYNLGDNEADGILEEAGADIYTDVVGDYLLELDDLSMTYSLTAL
ncbi:PKD domain-containing protein [Agarivorans sp. QJM3NY_33]|uniref:PKD domain-containing protein n=1 Tax=Agarivorans sp. QJM3NY_33 TaxID=3421432 RepID=UPI003D7C7F47